jgi:chromosome segregation ATPase
MNSLMSHSSTQLDHPSLL